MLKYFLACVILAGMACGCSHVRTASPPVAAGTDAKKLQIRNNAASLLADLLEDEKNVGKVFLVKSASSEVKTLVKLISATAAAHQAALQQLATNDPDLNLRFLILPPGEQAAREAIAKTKEHDLLFSSGVNFEFNLLLTQAEANNYGWHLAAVMAKNSTRPEEVQTFTKISESMKRLYEETIALMHSLPAN